MKKAVITILVVVVLAVGAFALASSNKKDDTKSNDSMSSMDMPNNQTQPETGQNVAQDTVEISDYAFGPANITVKAGTKVTWTNKDSVKHDVTSDDGVDNGPKSDLLGKDESYSFTFEKAGTYSYHCSPHPYMKGTVTVTE